MRNILIAFGTAFLFAAGGADAADKGQILSQIDGVRSAVENFAAKVNNNSIVVADIEAARSYVRKATQSFEDGKPMLGFGSMKPGAERDVAHNLTMAELNIALAESRLAKVKSSEELAAINAQLDKVKAKVKVFDDKKAVMEKLRVDAARYEAAAKELATLKTEKALLVSQVEMLMAERKQLEKANAEKGELIRQLDELKGENVKLVEQLEKFGQKPLAKPTLPPSPKAAPAPVAPAPVKVQPPAAVNPPSPALDELVPPEREKPSVPPAEATAPAPAPKPDAPAPAPKPDAPTPAPKPDAPTPEAAPAPAAGAPVQVPEPPAAKPDAAGLEELVAPEREKSPAPAPEEPPSAPPATTGGDVRR